MHLSTVASGILALTVVAASCRREADDLPILIEADTVGTHSGAGPRQAGPAALSAPPEVVVIEERDEEPDRVEFEPEQDRVADDGEERAELDPTDLELVDAEIPREPPERSMLPAGTRLALELRTPLHSATIRIGDRFAARTVGAVPSAGGSPLPAGALVEGRVAGVTRADDDEPGRIELDFRALVLPGGARLALDAEIASVAGRAAERAPGPGPRQVVGGAATGAGVGGVVGGSRGAVVGAVLGGVGAVLIAGARAHEVVVPSGTPLEITLRAPIEIPSP